MTSESPEQSQVRCPACAELILRDAKKCKHCGEWQDRAAGIHSNPILTQQEQYGVPYRIERQSQTTSSGRSSSSTSSVGLAIQGEVCPKCHVASYTNEYTVWHWLLAIFFFPLGLLVLLFPIKTCTKCNTPFGAGKKMAETVRMIAMVYLAFIGIVIFGVCTLVLVSK